jgi:hypothetical protein
MRRQAHGADQLLAVSSQPLGDASCRMPPGTGLRLVGILGRSQPWPPQGHFELGLGLEVAGRRTGKHSSLFLSWASHLVCTWRGPGDDTPSFPRFRCRPARRHARALAPTTALADRPFHAPSPPSLPHLPGELHGAGSAHACGRGPPAFAGGPSPPSPSFASPCRGLSMLGRAVWVAGGPPLVLPLWGDRSHDRLAPCSGCSADTA